MARHSTFVCQQCGYSQIGWAGKCPNCGTWGSLVETIDQEPLGKVKRKKELKPPVSLSSITSKKIQRIPTKISELDRSLGGGLVPGQVILLAGEPGIGKCVAGDTLISTRQGIKPIIDLKPEKAKKGFTKLQIVVQTPTDPKKATLFYISNHQHTKQFTTRMGYELQATYTHPVLTLSKKGKKRWKEMGKLKVGEFVAIQRHGAIWGRNISLKPFNFKINTNAIVPNFPKKIDKDMAYCLGLLVGDGGLTDFGHINLTTTDFEIEKSFRNWISRLGLKVSSLRSEYRLSVNNRIFHLWLKHLGLNLVKAELKYIPKLILSAPKEIIKAFLQGLFDTDGSSNCNPKGSMPGVIEYCTVSKTLSKQVHLTLLQFGIVGKLRFRKNNKKGAWLIELLGDNARLFYSEIGFRLTRKQKGVKLLSNTSNPNLDVVPYLPRVDLSKMPHSLRHDRRYFKRTRSPSYSKLEKLAKFIPELKELLEPKFYWDEIKGIKETGKSICFDLSIPKTHSFITNGIVSHNSTILLEVVNNLKNSLYVSGEESANQIKIRADRLKIDKKTILLLEEIDIDTIINTVESAPQKFDCVVIDSIQTMATQDLSGMAGSVGQVRECASRLVRLAKKTHIPVFLVGHITKQGSVAGPATLAHIVDTVLWFEGDKSLSLRLIRAVKNRFGPTDEVGIFQMEDKGLISVVDSGRLFVSDDIKNVPGSVVTSVVEGTRPLLVEIQALSIPTKLPYPKRVVQGIDSRRVEVILAVLQRRLGLPVGDNDIFVNVAGGISVTEPGADLAVAFAIASSYLNKPLPKQTLVFGEVGLLGEVRNVVNAPKREKEAQRQGFKNFITPKTVKSLNEAVKKYLR